MVCCLPVVGDGSAVLLAGFVVKDLVLDGVTFLFEAGHDAAMGGDSVAVMAGLEWLHEDGIAVAVVGQHYVLVATAGADGEAPHVVGVEFADGLDGDVEFLC